MVGFEITSIHGKIENSLARCKASSRMDALETIPWPICPSRRFRTPDDSNSAVSCTTVTPTDQIIADSVGQMGRITSKNMPPPCSTPEPHMSHCPWHCNTPSGPQSPASCSLTVAAEFRNSQSRVTLDLPIRSEERLRFDACRHASVIAAACWRGVSVTSPAHSPPHALWHPRPAKFAGVTAQCQSWAARHDTVTYLLPRVYLLLSGTDWRRRGLILQHVSEGRFWLCFRHELVQHQAFIWVISKPVIRLLKNLWDYTSCRWFCSLFERYFCLVNRLVLTHAVF